MRTRWTVLLGALLTTVFALFAGTGAATAATAATAASNERDLYMAEAREAGLSAAKAAGLQRQVDAYLAELDGTGTQVSPNQIDLGGAVLNVAVPGEKQPRQLGDMSVMVEGPGATECNGGARYLWFCAYSGANFTGSNIGMYTCGRAWGIPWLSTGSWHNNQSVGTRPLLTFTNGSTWLMPAATSSQRTGVNWAPVLNIKPC